MSVVPLSFSSFSIPLSLELLGSQYPGCTLVGYLELRNLLVQER